MYKTVEAILSSHLLLCEDTYQLLIKENRLLKQTGLPPSQEFLNQKQGLILRFDVSHRVISEANRTEARQFRHLIEKTQQVVLKTLLLDRENDQLLLKCTLGARRKVTPPAMLPSGLQKVYGQAVALPVSR